MSLVTCKPWQIAAMAGVLASAGGCFFGDRLVLHDGEVKLTYRCAAPETAVRSEQQRDLVRRQAIHIVQHANGQGDVAEALIEAYDRQDIQLLEQLVVDRLCQHPEEMHREPRFPEAGSPAPPFDLPVVAAIPGASGADALKLSDLAGRYVLLDFWATWCPPCVEKYPEMVQLADDYRDRGFTVVGILREDSPRRAVAWLEENGGVRYTWVNDGRSVAARAYQVRGRGSFKRCGKRRKAMTPFG